ncbi:hypothetical protein [Heyndrickxia oleronia]|uniref:hypothetical protein n=1 Tax=Heyndrickxia oleronia TaxID=38875 RepID=UPI001C0F3958|nr:hypothetical protein [Heyndrickxia oleronia]MBU5214359.1 hypothetical protein [Heyndrickxia oleronia]
MSVTIKDTNNIGQLMSTLKKMGKKELKVGIFGGGDLVMIGAVHEFGTEIKVTDKMRKWFAANGYPLKKDKTTIKIPERSFLRSGYDENVDAIVKKVADILPDVLENKVNTDVFMNAIGKEFAGMIQKKLKDLRDPANSSMTTKRKGSSNPLIDSGRLIGAIRHEVK